MNYTYNGKKIKLHGIFQFANVVEPSIMMDGHNGGQVSYPIAVIEHENGDIEHVHPHQIKRSDGGMKQIKQIYYSDPEKAIKDMAALGWDVVSKSSWEDSYNSQTMTEVVYKRKIGAIKNEHIKII